MGFVSCSSDDDNAPDFNNKVSFVYDNRSNGHGVRIVQ